MVDSVPGCLAYGDVKAGHGTTKERKLQYLNQRRRSQRIADQAGRGTAKRGKPQYLNQRRRSQRIADQQA